MKVFRFKAEADKKALGLEMARVKKRLIEAEREKHQAACQSAQSQRDAKSYKTQLKDVEMKIEETSMLLTKKAEELKEKEKLYGRYKSEKEDEIQKLKEQLMNLESKLNNQETYWNDRYIELAKVS